MQPCMHAPMQMCMHAATRRHTPNPGTLRCLRPFLHLFLVWQPPSLAHPLPSTFTLTWLTKLPAPRGGWLVGTPADAPTEDGSSRAVRVTPHAAAPGAADAVAAP
eukprot:366430-Chlamydomonas_euryale.AAC.16